MRRRVLQSRMRPRPRLSAPIKTPVTGSTSSSSTHSTPLPRTSGAGDGYVVKAYALNVRSGPSLTSPVVMRLTQGQPVTVLDILGDYTWAKIRTEKGWEGFVAWKQLTKLP